MTCASSWTHRGRPDSNVLVQAHLAHYRFNLCPGFWDWLQQANQTGDVHSVDAVYQEIAPAGDELSTWANGRRNAFFLLADSAAINAMASVAQWAQSQPNYKPAARTEFLTVADSFLVAHALGHGVTVVTHEQSSPNSKTTIKIPDACSGLAVQCMNPYEMLILPRMCSSTCEGSEPSTDSGSWVIRAWSRCVQVAT